MSAAHTPGPWTLRHVKESRSAIVFRGLEGGFVVMGSSPEQELADARLIAAAPEMLRALLIADRFCGSLTSDVCSDLVHIPIRDAIQKARGWL